MREEFTSGGARDFQQRYQGTYGWYSNEGKRLLVSLDHVGNGVVVFTGPNKEKYSANADQGIGFEFLPVERGLHNVDDDMFYMQRKVAKMYKRGICPENTQLYSFSMRDYMRIQHNTLEKVFVPPKVEVEVARWAEGKRTNVAFSNQFGVYDNKVYLYNQEIGTVDKKKFTVQKLFAQEIKDIVRDFGLSYTVEVSDAASK